MRTLNVVFATLLLLSPGLAAAQSIPPVAEPPMQLPVEAPPPFFVAQGPGSFPPPPHGGPQLGPGDPAGPGSPGPHRPTRMMHPGPGAWWKDSEIVKTLELSETQTTRIEQINLAHRLRLVDLRADLERQELGLQPLMDADRPEEAKVAAQLDLITTARGNLEKEHTLMLLASRRVLNVEQWKRLKAIEQERAVAGRGGPGDGPPAGSHGFTPGRRIAPSPPH